MYFYILTKGTVKKKNKVGRSGSARPKDYGIMFCSSLTKHPSGLIPFPFGLSASRPFKLLSFSFFLFCFFWKNIFFLISNARLTEHLLTCMQACSRDCMTACRQK